MTTQHNTTKLLAFLFLFFSILGKAYADGESCSTPYVITPSSTYDTHDYMINNSDGSLWITFVAIEPSIEIYNYETSLIPGTYANQMEAYDGSCGTLNLINSVVFDYTNVGQRNLNLENLIVGETYFVKIIGNEPNLNLSLSLNYFDKNASISTCADPLPHIVYSQSQTIAPLPYGAIVEVDPYVTITIPSNGTLIDNCKIYMKMGSKILVPNGLQLKGGSRIFGCNNMWQGIVVQGGDVEINENSMISDAYIAVDIYGGLVSIYDALFNRNNKAIVYNSSITVHTPVVPISNTIITSRDFALSYFNPNPSISLLKSIDPGTQKPYLDGYPIAHLINSSIIRPYSGVTDYHSYSQPLVIGQFPVGDTDNNIFDNLDFGIISRHSQTICYNNIFRRMPFSQSNLSGIYKSRGIGVIADGGNPFQVNDYLLSIGAALHPLDPQNTNTFFNCYEGVFSNYYSRNIIQANTFYSDEIDNPLYKRAIQIFPGAQDWVYGITNVHNNIINALREGTNCYVGNPNFLPLSFNFTSNTINVGPLNNLEGGTGMIFNGQTQKNGMSQPSPQISGNKVYNASKGIILNSFIPTIELKNNEIHLISSSNNASNASGININFSDGEKVTDNLVIGDYLKGSTNQFASGIKINHSKDGIVGCNDVSFVRQCFVFEGECANSFSNMVFSLNTLGHCNDGLVYLNSGHIGQNGNASTPADNNWTSNFDNSETLADLSDFRLVLGPPDYSLFYCYNSPGYFPTNNKYASFTNPLWVLDPMTASGPQGACSGSHGESNISNDPIEKLKNLLANAGEYPVLGEETEWQNKKYVYEKIISESTLSNSNDSIIVNFTDSVQNKNLATVVWSDEMIKQYQYYFAHYLVNGLSPENLLEQNYKTYTNYYLLWCENPNRKFSASEINDLYSVANQCSNLGGKAVLQAQLFLEYVIGEDANWNSNCPIPASSMRKAKAAVESKNAFNLPLENYLNISPLPAENYITFHCPKIDSPLSYKIFDLAGKKLVESFIQRDSNRIDLSSLSDGVYFIVFNLESNQKITKKLIVSHN